MYRQRFYVATLRKITASSRRAVESGTTVENQRIPHGSDAIFALGKSRATPRNIATSSRGRDCSNLLFNYHHQRQSTKLGAEGPAAAATWDFCDGLGWVGVVKPWLCGHAGDIKPKIKFKMIASIWFVFSKFNYRYADFRWILLRGELEEKTHKLVYGSFASVNIH